MKYYIDSSGVFFAYELDGSQDHLIGDKKPLTKEKFETLQKQQQKQQNDSFDGEHYKKKRELDYPKYTDFLDAWVKKDEDALEQYRKECLLVKEKYPKPKGF